MAKIEAQTVVAGEVHRYGTAIVVPEDMQLQDAVTIITQAAQYENKLIKRMAALPHEPLEVAYAFGNAVRDVCGTLLGQETKSWFGDTPPAEVSVEVEPGKYVQVLWGRFVFPFDPSDESFFHTGYEKQADGTFNGTCGGQFKQKYVRVWEQILERTRYHLAHTSLYRGRTLRVKFLDADGDPEPTPTIYPWDVRNASTAKLIFSRKLEEEIEDHILTPIRYKHMIEEVGTPFKRGVLLAGPYGTGKTELASAVAREAAERNMTVVYIEDVRELPYAVRFAARLAPAVVFAEDLDRVTSAERTHEIDVLLNTLDGIDTKTFPVMTIMTTNYPDKIYKGMVRPGRIDVALEIGPPDAEAAIRLVRAYLGSLFSDGNGDVDDMGDQLAGLIPAVVREICERSKLSSISRTKSVPGAGSITPQDVIRAAGGMKNQIALLNAEPKPMTSKAELALDALSEALAE